MLAAVWSCRRRFSHSSGRCRAFGVNPLTLGMHKCNHRRSSGLRLRTENMSMSLNRREWMQKSAQIALGVAVSNNLLAEQVADSSSATKNKPGAKKSFPAKFLWGAATAAHQVEGNNVNSDNW